MASKLSQEGLWQANYHKRERGKQIITKRNMAYGHKPINTGSEMDGIQQLVQEPKSPSHNCCPLAKAHQQRLFRYSRSLPRPLLEYQKLASHHPRRFADWISAFLNPLRHGHFREYTKSCMWGTRPVSFHFA